MVFPLNIPPGDLASFSDLPLTPRVLRFVLQALLALLEMLTLESKTTP